MAKIPIYMCPLCDFEKTLNIDEDKYVKEKKKNLPDYIMCGRKGCSGLAEKVMVKT